MKGIVLAGGSGTRLYPITKVISKQLLPVGDKPMVYYPISILILAGIKEILIISTPRDLTLFKTLLGNGEDLGVKFFYKEQLYPDGLAKAFILGEEFIGSDDVCLILGDNIFYGDGFSQMLYNSVTDTMDRKKATIFGYYVNDPERYGVIDFDSDGNILSIEEKPKQPKSNYAVVGLYFYPNSVVNIAKKVKRSERGELEITSINEVFLKNNSLILKKLGRGFAWFDTGTAESLYEASNFIQSVEHRQGLKIGCLEEIVYNKGYINKNQLKKLAKPFLKNQYGKYLMTLMSENN